VARRRRLLRGREPINGSTLYRARLAARPWRIAGKPERLTSYAGVSLATSTSARGRMVLALVAPVTNIWSASLPAGKGTTVGPLERVTADSNGKRHLTVAANGSRLAYASYGPPAQGNVEVRVRDAANGRESLIAGTGKWPFLEPVLSPDGSKVAYTDAPEARVGHGQRRKSLPTWLRAVPPAGSSAKSAWSSRSSPMPRKLSWPWAIG
jgi:Tol biopolymer transport system component